MQQSERQESLAPTLTLSHAGHLPTLDGWRAIAILTVMLHHGADSVAPHVSGPAAAIVSIFRNNGTLGVNIFFGISGFLICNRLLCEQQKYGAVSLKAFYIRRVFRILPPLALFLGL